MIRRDLEMNSRDFRILVDALDMFINRKPGPATDMAVFEENTSTARKLRDMVTLGASRGIDD